MFDGMSKSTFFLVTAFLCGLALFMAGFVIALEVRSVVASPAAASSGGGCYTNWNADTCAAGWTAVETGVWTVVGMEGSLGGAGGVVCATEKTEDQSAGHSLFSDTGLEVMNYAHELSDEPCAICCAVSAGAVGGIGELPEVAGSGDLLARNHVIIAAVTAAIAFGAGAFYARRRWSR
jgi:hypothetical protein